MRWMQMEKWQKEFMDNYDKLVVKEDSIIYEPNCLPSCVGKCCIGKDIMVYPYDVWRIMNDEKVSEFLGVTSSHDLYTSNNATGSPLLNYYLGPESRMPLAAISMIKTKSGPSICPFSSTVRKLTSDKDYAKFKDGKWENMDYMLADDGDPVLTCVLEKVKPLICRSYPLGRAGRIALQTDKSKPQEYPKMEYVLVPDAQCAKFRDPSKKMTVREYVAKWNLDKLFHMSDLVMQFYEYLNSEVKDEKARYLTGMLLYDFDLPALNLLDKMQKKSDKEAIRYIRPKDFPTLLEITRRTVDNLVKTDKPPEHK